MCDVQSLLPDSYRPPSRVLWAQRKKFVSIVIEAPVPVNEDSPVYLMSDDGYSLCVVFRGTPCGACLRGDDTGATDVVDADVFGAVIHLFDAARYGAVEGPTVVDKNRVKIGIVKDAFREWPRLTKEVSPHIRNCKLEYDWDLDGSYEEDEESHSSNSTQSDEDGDDDANGDGGRGVHTCEGCGEEYVALEKTSKSTGEALAEVRDERKMENANETDPAPSTIAGPPATLPHAAGGAPLLFVAVLIGGALSAVWLLWSTSA